VFVWADGQEMLRYVDSDGLGTSQPYRLASRYLWSNQVDQLLAEEQYADGAGPAISGAPRHLIPGETLWPLADHLGSVRDLVDNNGVIRNHVAFDSFGNRIVDQHYDTAGVAVSSTHAEAIDTLFGYTGRDWDADTELQYNRARWYDPNTGRWLSKDPIGFAAGDANLYRYTGNQPTVRTDPSGLEATLAIYIDTRGMPRNFNITGVQRELKKILSNASSAANVLLISTTRDMPYTELGWMDDRVSYFTETGWYNLNPLQWPVNAVHDCWVGIGDYFSDTEKFYVQTVQFIDPQLAGHIANTHGPRTTINLKGLNKHAAGFGKVNWDILYANIIAHEVIYLGLLGKVDDPSAALGSFGSNRASTTESMQITPEQRSAIDKALLCD